MQHTVTLNCDIDPDLYRLDAEYHVGIKKINLSMLSGNTLLGLCEKIVQGPNPNFADQGIPCLNGKNVYFGTSGAGEPNYITDEEYENYKNYHLRENDILITLKHATRIGRAWIFKNSKKSLFSRNLGLIRLKKNSKVNVETLLFYLWGDVPQRLLNLIATGGTNGQITLSMAELKKLPVPNFSKEFQDNIHNIFIKSEQSIIRSEICYQQAQNLLLSEIGLLDWKPKNQLSFIKYYSDTQQAGRFDAEYFQPKYEDLLKLIKRYSGGWDTVEKIVTIKDKNFNPEKKVEYLYIELADIKENGDIVGYTQAEGQELPTRARRKVATGDIIVSSIEGSLSRIALITDELNSALCSTGFYVVRSSQINAESLLVLLKSIVGQLQLKKGCSGTILTAINKDEFKKITLPIICNPVQDHIQQKVVECFNLRKQSKHLHECAKKAVEIAIEKDEESAIKWLENQIKGLEGGS